MVDFNIVNGKLIIDPQTLTVQAFNQIWDSDTDKVKTKASNMLTYIYHMKDIRKENPFRDLPMSQKEGMCKRNAFGKQDHRFNDKEQAMVDRAMAWYDVLNKTAVQRLSVSMDRKLDQISEFLDDTKNDIKTVDQLEDQSNAMQKIEKILASKKRVDEFVRDELEKSKVKGSVVLSPLAQGVLD